jgi:hypothetical protein
MARIRVQRRTLATENLFIINLPLSDGAFDDRADQRNRAAENAVRLKLKESASTMNQEWSNRTVLKE